MRFPLLLIQWPLMSVGLLAFTMATAAQDVTLQNGTRFSDDVQAHEGGMIQVGKTFYWVGTTFDADNAHTASFSLYESRDLGHWKALGDVLTPDASPELKNEVWERPKLLYNRTTHKFVMWFKLKKGPDALAAVAEADSVAGPYKFLHSEKPFGDRSGDPTLFIDDDGSAYFVSAYNTRGVAGEHHTMNIYRLTADYRNFDNSVPPVEIAFSQHSEAPALFKRGQTYYLIISGTTGWAPNQQQYMVAPSIRGPWTKEANLGDADCFHSQTTFVLPIYGTKETSYLWTGDQWNIPAKGSIDIRKSTYRWLPLQFAPDGSLKLVNFKSITVNVTTGTIRGNEQ